MELYTVREVAKMFNVNEHKVYDLIHLKKLCAYKLDGTYRIPIHEIYNYLEKVKTKS